MLALDKFVKEYKNQENDMSHNALEVSRIIREHIFDKTYAYGNAIPSERELAQTLQVNRNIIRNAIDMLIEEGLLKRLQGKGTYVIKTDIDDSAIHFKGMSELLRKAGYVPNSKVLTTKTRNASHKFSNIFHTAENTKMFQIVRLRSGNNTPISIENTTILHNSIQNIEHIDFQVYSLYDMFSINKIHIHTIKHIFSSSRAYNTFAKLLGLENGSPVVSIEIISFTKEGKVAEHTEVMVVPAFAKYYTDGIIKNGEFHLSSQLF